MTNHALEVWLFVCGALGVFFAWWESSKGPRERFLMLGGAWLIVVGTIAIVMLKVQHNQQLLNDNQQLLNDNQQILKDNQTLLQSISERLLP